MDTIKCPTKSQYKLIPMLKEGTEKTDGGTSIMVKPKVNPSPPSKKCSKCNSQRIVAGLISDSRRGRCFFAPAALKFWTITKSYGTKVESHACLNCGLVWMQTSPKMLEDFVRSYCDQKID